MSNVDVTLESPQADREWQAYFGEVDRLLRPLAADRRAEVRDELVSHVLDGMDFGHECCVSLSSISGSTRPCRSEIR